MMSKKLMALIPFIGITILGATLGFLVANSVELVDVPGTPKNQTPPEYEHFLIDPESLWVIVNKQHGMSEKYIPKDLAAPNVRLRLTAGEEQMQLAKPAHQDLRAMFKTAKKDDVTLVFGSGYRSGALQRQFYEEYVGKDGQKAADRYSARPGHSEHQTGLALDIVSSDDKCYLKACWGKTKEGKWVAANAHKYGFIIRYPNKKESITGYQYEPWHVRYVGRDLSQKIFESNKTLEEYFELEPAPDYN